MDSIAAPGGENAGRYPGHRPDRRWAAELAAARESARKAAKPLRDRFGLRTVTAEKGANDLQLDADLASQDVIVRSLRAAFPAYGVVAEEEPYTTWPDTPLTWAVDPLDGTNNFAYGIAHCAVAISLFDGEQVALGLVFDPLLEREFYAAGRLTSLPAATQDEVPLHKAAISLVTNYSETGHAWYRSAYALAAERCRRAVSLWAPALDLALVAAGAIDAVVCHEGYLLDVCGGLFLVEAAGGQVLDQHGARLVVTRSAHAEPVSFVAARSQSLARRLLDAGFLPG